MTLESLSKLTTNTHLTLHCRVRNTNIFCKGDSATMRNRVTPTDSQLASFPYTVTGSVLELITYTGTYLVLTNTVDGKTKRTHIPIEGIERISH